MPDFKQYDISEETLNSKARVQYGDDVKVSAPYWVDSETVRCGIWFPNSEVAYGVSYFYKEGIFR
jgi:hypothetical protein